MKRALLFPGQAAQFVGMGQHLYASGGQSKEIIEQANDLMGLDLSKAMFEGPVETLTQTIYTQPAVFLHSYLVYLDQNDNAEFSAVAGHSLGELTALVAAGVLSFEDGLRLVKARAEAMQMACDKVPGTMAAILGMGDADVEAICAGIDAIVIPANYNCPGQLVVSGSKEGIDAAIEKCKEAGARRALEISVGGAFHSPLMEPAMDAFREAAEATTFNDAKIPVYQNVDAKAHTDATEIKANIIKQVISPVRWTQSIQNMIADGIDTYVEVGGKGKIIMGMLRKISREIEVSLWSEQEA